MNSFDRLRLHVSRTVIQNGAATLTDTGTIGGETGTIELTGATVSVSGAIEGAGKIEFGPASRH